MNTSSSVSPRRSFPVLFSILDRMIALELLKTIGAVLLVLVTIIVSRKFLAILAKAIEGEVAGETIFQLLGLKILSATAMLLPAAVFMSILIVLGRMYRDQEISILSGAGVGPARLYRALSWMVLPILLGSAWLALETMPWAERQVQELMRKDEERADIRGLKAGQFNEFSAGDVVLYAEELRGNHEMKKIFVQNRQENKIGVVIADHGVLERNESDEYFVILNDGRRYQGVPGRTDYVLSKFDTYGVRIDSADETSAAMKSEAEDSGMLWRSRTPRELAELQKRLAIPIGMGFLALLALPLSRIAPRAGVFGNVFSAFLIYIAYENAQKIAQGMLMTGKITPWLSYSGIYAVMAACIVFLLARNLGWSWLIRCAFGRETR